jgi:ectoine hydroxylase-related dioxygenase (phytanoyl-CoA dioxygenase family)
MITTPFSDEKTSASFTKNGFVTFPLLDTEELAVIRTLYHQVNRLHELEQEQFYGVNYSLSSLPKHQNEEMMEKIKSLLDNYIARVFSDFETFGFLFITKPANTNREFVLHQDWCYTDEKSHAMPTCWIPLYDVDQSNGCMTIIKGSHTYFETYRSESLASARIDIESIPLEIREDVPLAAGSCCAFHQASFHGSYPNKTDFSRPVLAFIAKHKLSPILYYVKKEKEVVAYQLSVDFFSEMLSQIPNSGLPPDDFAQTSFSYTEWLPTKQEVLMEYRKRKFEHRLLKSQQMNDHFIEKGFVIIPNVLPQNTITSLRELYTSNFSTPKGMFVSHHSEREVAKNQAYSQQIFVLLQALYSQYFEDVKPLIAHFAVKAPGEAGLFNLHQDWSIVREELYGVAHCWIPLQDVSITNGTLAVLPSSHLQFSNYRSGTCPIRFLPFGPFEELVQQIEVKAGDVVLYHPALFHGSLSNNSDTDRLAVVAAVAHPEAATVYHHSIAGDVWLYELLASDLYGRLDDLAKGEMPSGNQLNKLQYRILELTDAEIVETIKNNIN